MSLSVALAALTMGICPQTAPSITLLTIDRVLLGIFQTQLTGNPLIMDYIKQESRGKAIAF